MNMLLADTLCEATSSRISLSFLAGVLDVVVAAVSLAAVSLVTVSLAAVSLVAVSLVAVSEVLLESLQQCP